MTDYAAVVLQAAVQGVLKLDGTTPQFQGRGVSSVVRNAAGDFTLVLDQSLQGATSLDGSVTPSIPPGVAGAVPVFGRTVLTLRGSPTNAEPGVSSITQKAVSYGNLVGGVFVAAPAGTPATAIRVFLSIAGTGTDPTGTAADGCEVIVFRANTAADNFTQQIVGPLYGN